MEATHRELGISGKQSRRGRLISRALIATSSAPWATLLHPLYRLSLSFISMIICEWKSSTAKQNKINMYWRVSCDWYAVDTVCLFWWGWIGTYASYMKAGRRHACSSKIRVSHPQSKLLNRALPSTLGPLSVTAPPSLGNNTILKSLFITSFLSW